MLFDTAIDKQFRYGMDLGDYNAAIGDLKNFDTAADNGYKYGKPIGDAAMGFLSAIAGPFGGVIQGLYQGGTLGVDAMVRGRRKQLAAKAQRLAQMGDTPGFLYGMDDNGQFFQKDVEVPKYLDSYSTHPESAAIGAGIGKAVGGALSPNSTMEDMMKNAGMGPYSTPGEGGDGYTSFGPSDNVNAPGAMDESTSINITPSSGNMDWGSRWTGGGGSVQGFKDGGVMVTGGEDGEDDIALVNANTGADTGKRVSKGEMLVVSEDNLAALSVALKKGDKKSVFNIMQDQVKQKPKKVKGKDGFANGGFAKGWDKGLRFNEDGYIIPEANGGDAVDVNASVTQPGRDGGTLEENLAYYLPSAVDSGFDAYRLYAGLDAAKTKTPVFRKPSRWQELMNRSELQSMQGLSPQELALYNDTSEGQYRRDLSNIYNMSGGSNAIALGNIGRANEDRYSAALKLAALNRQTQDSNLASYGNMVAQDVNLDRTIFGDAYAEAKAIQGSGAKLANDAIANIKQRNITDQFYSPQSVHGQTQRETVNSTNETRQQQRNFLKFIQDNPDVFKYSVGSTSGATDVGAGEEVGRLYDDYVANGGKLSYSEFTKSNKK